MLLSWKYVFRQWLKGKQWRRPTIASFCFSSADITVYNGFCCYLFLYAHTYWCYSSIVRSLTLFNCKSCSYTCTHTLHTFLISVCIFCVRVHFYFLWSSDERAFGVLHRTGMPLILYEFYCYDDFSFQFHCTPLFRRTFNRRHWQFTWKRTIYLKHIC